MRLTQLASFSVLILLAGCNPLRFLVKPAPVDLQCDEECSKPCESLPKWDGTADQAAALLKIDGIMYALCDTKRGICQRCIERGRSAGAIK